ncbi:hypothetical protein ACFP81_10430 [Deinococcus lacus]|uniref:Uncharacterized protein n=1 Tax=Deinococcus lacus TaxID=392561 RepID=A0ABW1YGL0_9DEIO
MPNTAAAGLLLSLLLMGSAGAASPLLAQALPAAPQHPRRVAG